MRGLRYEPVRILVVSALYPPVALGGYEVECAGVVERLRERHEVLVLTGEQTGETAGERASVRRELPRLAPTPRELAARPARLSARCRRRAAGARVGAGPDLRLERRSDPTGGVARARRQRCAARLSRVRALVRRHLRAATSSCVSCCRRTGAGAGGVGGRLPRAQLAAPAAPAARPRRCATAISWNSRGDQAHGDASSRSSSRCSSGWATPSRATAISTPRSCASRRPTRRSCSSGGSPPTRVWRSRSRRSRCCAPSTASQRQLVVVGPEDTDHGGEMRRLAERLGVAEAVRWHGPTPPERVARACSRGRVR